jgi:hypothetical protein
MGGGRPLFAGMIREFAGGARIHFDEVVREFPGVFDSRNYHSVTAGGEGPRVTLSFFIGVTAEGRLVIWS